MRDRHKRRAPWNAPGCDDDTPAAPVADDAATTAWLPPISAPGAGSVVHTAAAGEAAPSEKLLHCIPAVLPHAATSAVSGAPCCRIAARCAAY